MVYDLEFLCFLARDALAVDLDVRFHGGALHGDPILGEARVGGASGADRHTGV